MSGPKPKHRGTIIVDANALIDLCAKVSPHLTPGGVPNHLSLLQFLSRHGYRILIPEMAALDAGGGLANGKNIQKDFHQTAHPESFNTLKPFLRDAALPNDDPNKDCPGIEIVRNTGPAHINAYCKAMTEASEEANPIQSRSAIMKVHATKQRNFSEKAILSLLGHRERFEPGEAVTILSRDNYLKSAGQGPQILYRVISPMKLVYSMAVTGMAARIGFDAGADPETLRQAFFTNTYQLHRTRHSHELTPIDALTAKDIARTPFHRSLQELCYELAVVPEVKAAEAQPGEKTARFKDKYARFSTARAKAAKGTDESPGRG